MQKSRLNPSPEYHEISRKTRERPGGHWAYTNKFCARYDHKKSRRQHRKITEAAVASFHEEQRLDMEEALATFDDWWWEDYEVNWERLDREDEAAWYALMLDYDRADLDYEPYEPDYDYEFQ